MFTSLFQSSSYATSHLWEALVFCFAGRALRVFKRNKISSPRLAYAVLYYTTVIAEIIFKKSTWVFTEVDTFDIFDMRKIEYRLSIFLKYRYLSKISIYRISLPHSLKKYIPILLYSRSYNNYVIFFKLRIIVSLNINAYPVSYIIPIRIITSLFFTAYHRIIVSCKINTCPV